MYSKPLIDTGNVVNRRVGFTPENSFVLLLLSSHRAEVPLCRIRIDRTNLTNSHISTKPEPSLCSLCNYNLIVIIQPVLIYCQKYTLLRKKSQSLNTILLRAGDSSSTVDNLFSFFLFMLNGNLSIKNKKNQCKQETIILCVLHI